MFKIDSLQCDTCGWMDAEYFFDTKDIDNYEVGDKPNCPVCDSATRPWFANYRIRAIADNFTPFTWEGRTVDTRSEFRRIKADIEARKPGHRVVLNDISESAEQVAREERRHEVWRRRKEKGIDEAMMRKWDADRKAGDPEAKNNSLTDLVKGRIKPAPKLSDRATVQTSAPAISGLGGLKIPNAS